MREPRTTDTPPQCIPPAEYCPVSIGAQLLGDRWVLLIIRELMPGASGYNDIHRGLPGISRSVLSGRLRHLERLELVEQHHPPGETTRTIYALTRAGKALRPLIEAIGKWTIDWRLPDPGESEVDPSLLLWRISQGLDESAVPDRDVCIEFHLVDANPARGYIHFSKRGSRRFACFGAPEHETDVLVTARPEALQAVWFGQLAYRDAIGRKMMILGGTPGLVRQFPQWFRLSPFAQQIKTSRSTSTFRGRAGV